MTKKLTKAYAQGFADGGLFNILSADAISYIWVSPDGSDTEGIGAYVNPYKTLTKAMAMVTAARKIIMLMPGEYAEAAAVAWSTVDFDGEMGVSIIGLFGADVTSISVPSPATSVITVTPGAQTKSWQGLIRGVEIVHDVHSTTQSGITISNASIGKKLNFYIKNCLFTPDDDYPTDKSINVATHSDVDNAVRIYISGDGNQSEIGGAIYFAVGNLADRLHLEQVWIKGTITTSADAKELRIRLYKCIVPSGAALAGGSSTQIVTSVCSYSWIDYDDITAEIYHALDTADLGGSHSEVIVG